MVGGFGSNQYLSEFLKSKLPPGTELKRPALGYTNLLHDALNPEMDSNHPWCCFTYAGIELCPRKNHAPSLWVSYLPVVP
jgi:hypothetical protein